MFAFVPEDKRPPYKPIFQEDEDGWSQWPLWGLMAEFGDHLRIGFTNLFFVGGMIRTDDPKTQP